MIMKLKDICDFQSGGTPSKRNSEFFNGTIPWITTTALNNSKINEACATEWITESAIVGSAAKIVPAHSIMVGTRVGVGKVAINTVKMSTNQDIIALLNIDERNWSKEYLCKFIQSKFDYLNSQSRGATIKGIKIDVLANLKITQIPLNRQKEVSKTIDKVQKILEDRKKQLQGLDKLVKARFVEMFGSVRNNVYGYKIKMLQDVCEPIKDGTHQTPTYVNDAQYGFKFLSSKDVTSGKINWSKIKYIPSDLHEELYAKIKPKRGDILLAKNGTTGVAAVVETDEIFDIYVSLALLRPIDMNSIYLWAAVNSADTKLQFDSSLKGIGVPNLHLGEIKKAKIIVPPLELQNQFADFVTQVDKSKAAVQKALDETQLLFDSLMQEYFG